MNKKVVSLRKFQSLMDKLCFLDLLFTWTPEEIIKLRRRFDEQRGSRRSSVFSGQAFTIDIAKFILI